MDPARAMTLLNHAALLSVPIKGKYEDLMSLSSSSEAEIRQSCKKNGSMVAAKKYLKAIDALSELERAMAPFMGTQTHTSTQPPQKPKSLKPNLYQVGWVGFAVTSCCMLRYAYLSLLAVLSSCSCLCGGS